MNDLQFIAPMVIAVVFILTVGGVLILRPIAKHLGAYLEQLTQEKAEGRSLPDFAHLQTILESMDQRLSLMEERQEFTDRLLVERNLPDQRPDQLAAWQSRDETGS